MKADLICSGKHIEPVIKDVNLLIKLKTMQKIFMQTTASSDNRKSQVNVSRKLYLAAHLQFTTCNFSCNVIS